MREVIRQKLADALVFEPPELTRRDVRLPKIPRRAHAIIGMRRAGKTYFLHQCLRERMEAGAPRESQVYFSFEDERLAGLTAADLGWVLEEYFIRYPHFRDQQQVTFFFDEIQVVPGWESFVRRVLDTEKIEIFVSGSSARMLSREVATSLRGRATETIIFPFSFREFLRHRGVKPPEDPGFLPKARRSHLEKLFREYLTAGGFPEAQGLEPRDRLPLLQSYVDAVIFRDVIERHGITNVVVLRRLTRQLLGAATGLFSVHRFLNDLRSQGAAASKDTLHAMLAHLEDAFLLRLGPLATSSERQRQSNPRKVYPIDAGLISAFDRSGKSNLGQVLETVVRIELERRGSEICYVRTPDGFEVDFLATPITGRPILIQVCAGLADAETRAREFRALQSARLSHRNHPALLLTLTASDAVTAQAEAPEGITAQAAWEWLLMSERVF
ncbi:MAG: ATP-binding protein [Blastocatellia bacterium]